jgi:hypothetical protein
MTYSGVERRRTPRLGVEQSYHLSLETSVGVQVLDISRLGVQFRSKFALAAGDRAELCTTLASETVRIPIEIRRVTVENASSRGGMQYRAGAVFGPMSVEQRVLLEQLLGSESN